MQRVDNIETRMRLICRSAGPEVIVDWLEAITEHDDPDPERRIARLRALSNCKYQLQQATREHKERQAAFVAAAFGRPRKIDVRS